ncbi:MAG TPA: HD domain-containing phosphohydrolase [Vicinamibacterales bacterium]|jgi:putative nucleotidyltransferase with HDIG domain|nr:HD domain-containing phosphohydrolase [Vicinamibacterales bacterium]
MDLKSSSTASRPGGALAHFKKANFEKVNKELWLILSMFIIALLLNFVVDSQRMMLSFYTLPTLGSAYLYGRRQATLTAFASVLLVALLTATSPGMLTGHANAASTMPTLSTWLDLAAWGGILIVTGYLMGTLYEHTNTQLTELRETYNGVLMLLRHFISKDEYTEHHSYRVSVYAARIAAHLSLPSARIEDVRAAGLLHDIGKLEVSRELLYKAARFTREEYEEIQRHVEKGVAVLETVGGSLRRVIPIVLAHHDKFNGSGYHATKGDEIPLEARIISVADVYDSLTSDRPYRKAMSPFDAKDIILKGTGTDFDPQVVEAFLDAFRFGEMDVRTAVA